MGYRSHGAIWLSEAAFELLKTKEYGEHDDSLFDTLKEFDYFEEANVTDDISDMNKMKGFIAEFNHWKWYDSFPEVQAWIDFMEECSHSGIAYDFVRIGEDPTDIEIHTEIYFQLDLAWEPNFSDPDTVSWIFDSGDERLTNGWSQYHDVVLKGR